MIYLSTILVMGCIWIKSGHSPFFWLAQLFIILDASLRCTYQVISAAIRMWLDEIPGHIAQVRAEVAR